MRGTVEAATIAGSLTVVSAPQGMMMRLPPLFIACPVKMPSGSFKACIFSTLDPGYPDLAGTLGSVVNVVPDLEVDGVVHAVLPDPHLDFMDEEHITRID